MMFMVHVVQWKSFKRSENSRYVIGISNFTVDRAVDLSVFNEVTPTINQIEINPFNQQTEAIEALIVGKTGQFFNMLFLVK